MESAQVVLLAFAGLVVGVLCTVMVQVWITLRQLQHELRATQAKVDPLIDELRNTLAQVRSTTQVASAVAMAVTAGVQAWRHAKGDTVHEDAQ